MDKKVRKFSLYGVSAGSDSRQVFLTTVRWVDHSEIKPWGLAFGATAERTASTPEWSPHGDYPETGF